ncbi:Microcystin degradation protein MlrC, contains DUF1485 domain [Salinihabitans flavidus]|uniref:Microcystinase C n=1 Tax=Salinihabitans flavidus TaxID=569882 RepID=A0A1H8TLA7_9RHOB|nr:M81 family metallopeptidase [Salinihabitans flavidus]SEO91635.1 Microcystin degradation protein MlrC, contains DUF1485 domain [Salinihabitans flavidus]
MKPNPAERGRPRIAIGCVLHETNSFNRRLTGLADFASRYLFEGSAPTDLAGTNTEIAGFLDAAEAHGWEAVPLLAASCAPSGPLAAGAWEDLRGRLHGALAEAGRLDGVLFALHGAMQTQTTLDADGELLAQLRETVGDVPVIATLDMHANVSPRMASLADAVTAYRSYPHIDQRATGLRAGVLLAEQIRDRRPRCVALAQPPLLDSAAHGRTNPPGPMNALLEEAERAGDERGIDTVSLQIGFPWGDCMETGPSVTVTGTDAVRAQRIADSFAARLAGLTESVDLDFPDARTAVAEALAAPGGRPVVLADFADNPSAGAYGDSPNLLRALCAAGASDTVFATLCDPETVARARKLGAGGCGEFHLGGRWTPELTPPLSVKARVERLSDGHFTCEGPMWTGSKQSLGDSVLLSIGGTGGIRVVVTSRAVAVTDRNLLRLFGIDPSRPRILALKSRNHCRAAFGPIASGVILTDAGGIASMRLRDLPYTHVRRPIWPLDPFATTT